MLSIPNRYTFRSHAQNNKEHSSDHGARVQMCYGNMHDRKSQVGFALLCLRFVETFNFALCLGPPQPLEMRLIDFRSPLLCRATAFYSSTWHGTRLPTSVRHFYVYLSFPMRNLCCLTWSSGNMSRPQASGAARSNGENLGEGQPWGQDVPVGPPSERTPATSGLQSPERHAARIAI